MNSFAITTPTATACIAAIGAAMLTAPIHQQRQAHEHFQISRPQSTHSEFLRKMHLKTNGVESFKNEISAIYGSFIESQEPLEQEFANIIYKNLEQLYEA